MASQTEQKQLLSTKQLLERTTDYLQKQDVDQPRLSAELLLAHVLKCRRIDLYVKFDYCPTEQQLDEYRQLVRRCGQHEPVAYLTGQAHFYSIELQVKPGVLIPRPETELLVTGAIDFLCLETDRPTPDVLDLCTGSGCIAIAIAENVIEAEFIASDLSPEALEIAKKNIEKHDLQNRITLWQGDLFDNMDQAPKGLFDLIVSNPPYISNEEFEKLAPVVKDYEPKDALFAGEDGLEYHRRIITQAEPYLADNGALMVEVGYNQHEQVIDLFEQADYLKDVATVRDELGHNRIIKAKRK